MVAAVVGMALLEFADQVPVAATADELGIGEAVRPVSGAKG